MTSRLLLAWTCLIATIGTTWPAPAALAADVTSQSCDTVPAATADASDALASFQATTPRRLVDTRDGTGGVAEPVGEGCTLRVDMAAADVPAEAAAVALSVTALGSQPGFLTIFPCSGGLPETSNLNTRAEGFPTPNLVVAIPDPERMVCIYSLFEADVIVDLTGWWTDEGDHRLTTTAPVRADDSRNDAGRPLVPARTTRTIALSTVIPPEATAVVGNLTVTEPEEAGFITAFPCDRPLPASSNLNFRAGESRAVAIVVGLDAAANLCVSASTDLHVVFDVSGYYSPAPQFGPAPGFQPVAGQRLADSRTGEGGWSGKFGDRLTRRLRPTAGLPNDLDATAVVLNIVVTEADDLGFITVSPCDDETPDSSAVNYSPAGESTNMVVVDLSSAGEICVFALASTHVVVDLFGVLVADDGEFVERFSFDAFTWPGLTADGTDYIVECNTGTTDLHIELLRSSSARVNGVPVSSGTIDLPTQPDDRVRVRLQRGSSVRNYSFRCVPDDFPRLEIDRPGEPAAGWYLTSIRVPDSPGVYPVILDGRGVPVWYTRVTGGDITDVQRRSDGHLDLMPTLGPRYGVDPERGYVVASLSGTVIDERTTVPDPAEPGVVFPTDHHEALSFPDGGYALLSYPILTGQDLTVLGEGFLVDDEIADGVIQEIAADGTPWTWRTSDYFGYDEVPYPIRWGPLEGYDGEEVDVFHPNSLQRVDDGTGDYVVSARHLDAVFRVDRSTGTVDWILGSLPADTPNASGAPRLEIIGDPRGGPRRQHDARLNGDVLTMFDNRTDTGEPARAVAYQIDTAAGTATMLWQIEEPGQRSSPGLGSGRITTDDSVLISWGALIQPVFAEFDLDGNALMEIAQTAGGNSYRITKEPVSAFSIDVLRSTAGGEIALP